MPKHLVTALGIVVCVGVIALGVFLVALPLYFQALRVDGQTAAVASTNAIYDAQLANLRAQEERLDEINGNVDALRAQIPAAGDLDDVFLVVARAAESSGVSLTAVTAGEQTDFVARTGVEESEAPAPPPTEDAAETTDDPSAALTEDAPAEPATPSGRLQVDFTITANGDDMGEITAFLDALRAGPRLLSSIDVTSLQNGEAGVDVQVSALTYVDQEG